MLPCKEIVPNKILIVALVLDVCLVKFCVDILSIVDICSPLVVQENFLCT